MNYKRIAITIGLYIIIAIPLFFVALYYTNLEPEYIYASIFDNPNSSDILVAEQENILNIEPAAGK